MPTVAAGNVVNDVIRSGAMIVTEAVAVFVLSAILVAVIDTVEGEGTPAGAVYKPSCEIVPNVAFPPATLLTLQVT
jgi:hypothetical protein